MPAKEPLHITDPETLRAMAHPLRQRVLVELNVREHARAADLAKALDEPANSISFHLRVLARHRFIEEAPELARDKRDRVWRPKVEQFVIDSDIAGAEHAIDPHLHWLRDMFLRDRTAPEEQDSFHEGAVSGAFLTRDEAAELSAEVTDVLEKWWDRTAAAKRATPEDPDRKYYQVLFAIGPRTLGAERTQES